MQTPFFENGTDVSLAMYRQEVKVKNVIKVYHFFTHFSNDNLVLYHLDQQIVPIVSWLDHYGCAAGIIKAMDINSITIVGVMCPSGVIITGPKVFSLN